jgi:hypothetical protein
MPTWERRERREEEEREKKEREIGTLMFFNTL